MTDRDWDRRLHIRTIGREDEANAHYSPYEPTPYAVLERLAESGFVRRKQRLLDYGCGKGRVALFMAARVGCRTAGIDYSKKLIDIASENRRSARLGDRVTLTCCRAEQYDPEEDVFFFFNPFSEKVFQGVLRRIEASRQASPRPLRLLLYYPSPAYMEILENTPGARREAVIDCGDLFHGRDPRERIEIFALEPPEGGGR